MELSDLQVKEKQKYINRWFKVLEYRGYDSAGITLSGRINLKQ